MPSPPDKNKDQYRILEESRQAAVQAAANVLDGLSKAKKLRRRFEATYDDDRERSPGDDRDDKSDFLFDMLRLNATYMNEVARVGARYRDFAYRALENMYRIANPGLKNQGADELVFALPKGQASWNVKEHFMIQNDVNPATPVAEIDVPRIWSPKTNGYVDVLRLLAPHTPVGTPDARRHYEVELPFGRPTAITFEADLLLCRGRRIDDHIEVRIDLGNGRARVRRIALVLDGRAAKDPNPGSEYGDENPAEATVLRFAEGALTQTVTLPEKATGRGTLDLPLIRQDDGTHVEALEPEEGPLRLLVDPSGKRVLYTLQVPPRAVKLTADRAKLQNRTFHDHIEVRIDTGKGPVITERYPIVLDGRPSPQVPEGKP